MQVARGPTNEPSMDAISVVHRREKEMSSNNGVFHVSLLVFASIFALLFNVASDSSLLRDPDTLWHIAVGRRILETGSFPWVDDLSHTFAGHPWIANQWLSQIIYYLVYDAGGWRAVFATAIAAVALTYTNCIGELCRHLMPTAGVSVTTIAYALAP